VAVVTDCTACLPAELAPQLGVTVVPLRIVAGGLAADDGPGVLDGPLGGELRRGQRLSTARPGPAKFAAAYAAAAGSGAAAVVSVHLSGQLSGTVRSARLAAAGAALPVHVVDSLSIGMRLGFGVLAAARSAGRAGGGRGGGRSEPLGGQARFLFRPRLTGLPAGWRPARAARRGGGAPWRRAGTARGAARSDIPAPAACARRAARSDIPAAAACARRPDHRAGAGAPPLGGRGQAGGAGGRVRPGPPRRPGHPAPRECRARR